MFWILLLSQNKKKSRIRTEPELCKRVDKQAVIAAHQDRKKSVFFFSYFLFFTLSAYCWKRLGYIFVSTGTYLSFNKMYRSLDFLTWRSLLHFLNIIFYQYSSHIIFLHLLLSSLSHLSVSFDLPPAYFTFPHTASLLIQHLSSPWSNQSSLHFIWPPPPFVSLPHSKSHFRLNLISLTFTATVLSSLYLSIPLFPTPLLSSSPLRTPLLFSPLLRSSRSIKGREVFDGSGDQREIGTA